MAVCSNRLLDGGCHSSAKWLWKVNWCEERRGVQVVLAGLVNDPDLTMLGGLPVSQYLVEFTTLEGYLVPLIVQTDDESLSCWHDPLSHDTS